MSRSLVFHKDLPGPAYVSGSYRITLVVTSGSRARGIWEVTAGSDVIGHAHSVGGAKDIACAFEERLRSQTASPTGTPTVGAGEGVSPAAI